MYALQNALLFPRDTTVCVYTYSRDDPEVSLEKEGEDRDELQADGADCGVYANKKDVSRKVQRGRARCTLIGEADEMVAKEAGF